MILVRSWLDEYIELGQFKLEHATKTGLEFVKIDADTFEVEITPNRGDCLSVYGVARELHNTYGLPWRFDAKAKVNATAKLEKSISTDAVDINLNFLELHIKQAKTPKFITTRLEKAQIATSDFLNDMAAYVELALGQPIFIYDASKIGSKITLAQKTINFSQAVENYSGYGLFDQDAVISIAGAKVHEKYKAVASSTHVLIEASYYPKTMMHQSAKHKYLSGSATYKYVRGIDPDMGLYALQFFYNLVKEYVKDDIKLLSFSKLSESPKIKLNLDKLNSYTGNHYDMNQVIAKLSQLDIQYVDGFFVPPAYRHDIHQEVDLIEEIVRVFGCDNIESSYLPVSSVPVNFMYEKIFRLKQLLANLGFNETNQFTFASSKDVADNALKLKNPLSMQQDSMQQSQLPTLINVLQGNIARKQQAQRLFSISKVFTKDYQETQTIALMHSAPKNVPHWSNEPNEFDMYDLKGLLNVITKQLYFGYDLTIAPKDNSYFQKQMSFAIICNNAVVGFLGQLLPSCAKAKYPVFALELNILPNLIAKPVVYSSISDLHPIKRDMAFEFSSVDLDANAILDFIAGFTHNKFTVSAEIFDYYINKTNAKHSIGIKLIMQPNSNNVVEAEINSFLFTVANSVAKKFNLTLKDKRD